MRLDHVHKREGWRIRLGGHNDTSYGSHAAMLLTEEPDAERRVWEPEIVRRLGQPVVRHLPGTHGRGSSRGRTRGHGADRTGGWDRKSTSAVGGVLRQDLPEPAIAAWNTRAICSMLTSVVVPAASESIMSRRTASGRSASTATSALAAVVARRTSYPSSSAIVARTSWTCRSSSTTRTITGIVSTALGCARWPLVGGPRRVQVPHSPHGLVRDRRLHVAETGTNLGNTPALEAATYARRNRALVRHRGRVPRRSAQAQHMR